MLRNAKQRGFTLIELMVTIAVAAILIAVGIPSFSDFIKRGQITEQRDTLYASLMLARSEAVNRSHSMSLCVSSNQTSCDAVGGGSVSWSSGWLVFVDLDRDGAVDAGETVLKVVKPDFSGSLVWDNGDVITYDSEGGADKTGTFTICEAGKDVSYARAIIISSSGRIRRDTTSANGGALVCN